MEQNFKSMIGIKNKKEINIQEEKIKPERAKRLEKFCSERANEIRFIDKEYGNELDKKEINKNQINPKAIENLDEDDIQEIFIKGLKTFKSYVAGPIFTDSKEIHRDIQNLEDISTRVGWERTNLSELDPEEKKYYCENRLNVGSRINPAYGYLNLIVEIVKNLEIKGKLENLIRNIPKELTENGGLEYNTSSNDKKVEIVKKFSEILKEIISILENKHNINEN